MEPPCRKPIHWIGSSKKDLAAMPEDVQDVFGSALLDAQYGDVPVGARPFGEHVSREVMKLAEDHDGNTYRAAYTVMFPECVYVLHVFMKKSKSGVKTPKPDKNTVESRLTRARQHYAAEYSAKKASR
jgi:phage-related protein